MPDIKDELIADLRGQIRSCRCPYPVLKDTTIGACVDGGQCGCLHKEAASDVPATDIVTVAGNAAVTHLALTRSEKENAELREALTGLIDAAVPFAPANHGYDGRAEHVLMASLRRARALTKESVDAKG